MNRQFSGAAADSLMFQEAGASGGLAAAQLAENRPKVSELAAILRQKKPRAVITIARGSSDHASSFARYLIETRLGILTSSLAPSVGAVYRAKLDLAGVVCLTISQSGRSPDLLSAVETAKAGGAYVVAMVNAEQSPLDDLADMTLPLRAGPELSVAATKSFILAMTAVSQLVAEWGQDMAVREAVQAVPELLDAAWRQDWSEGVAALSSAQNLFVVGRGLGFGIALEAALKFKETCGLHAEAFSSAEVQHGPMALVGAGFPVLLFAQNDETKTGLVELANKFIARDAKIILAGAAVAGARNLPAIMAHPVLEPILLIQSFYRMAACLAVARGFDPDRPPYLNKVTQTL